MLKNYLITTFRNSRRQKGYAFINVAGLAIGLTCSFFILHWVMNELSYDRFHEDGERLFRVMRHGYLEENTYTWGSVPKPLADVLERDYPEVENAMLVTGTYEGLIAHEGEVFKRQGQYVDASFFEAFTFPLVRGDASTVLDDPQSIVISEDLASSLFGADWRTDASVIGEVLHVENRADFRVTGVFENVPDNSSIQFDFVLPMSEYLPRNEWVENWGNAGLQLYVRLKPDADYRVLNEKIKDVIRENKGFADATPFLHPYTDMRLHSEFRDGKLVGGRITYVRVFSAMAVFLLLIACINFMNLANAFAIVAILVSCLGLFGLSSFAAEQRRKEIGVRKVLGSSVAGLVVLLSKDFTRLVMVAFVLAAPLAYFATFKWLGRFEHHAEVGATIFALAGIATLLIALLSISYQAIRAAVADPVKSLRYE